MECATGPGVVNIGLLIEQVIDTGTEQNLLVGLPIGFNTHKEKVILSTKYVIQIVAIIQGGKALTGVPNTQTTAKPFAPLSSRLLRHRAVRGNSLPT